MHLDPRCRRVPDGAVRELVHVEVAVQLAIDPHEQVAIERRGHAERIVVGQQQLGLGLLRDRCRGAARRPRRAPRGRLRRNASTPGGSKLPMFDPRKTTSVCPLLAARTRDRRQAHPRRSPDARRRGAMSAAASALVALSSAAADTSTRCTVTSWSGQPARSVTSFSPLPGPSSTTVETRSKPAERSPARARAAAAVPFV